jgi:hypothetical protein
MSLLDILPNDISTIIITSDPQTWRAMRRVSTYYHQLLNWDAYVDKFTVVSTVVITNGVYTPFQIVHKWFLDGELHREHDRPALVNTTIGHREWYRYGYLHRDYDRPAQIRPGVREWFHYGQRHRYHDRPSFINNAGDRVWYRRGILQRRPKWSARGVQRCHQRCHKRWRLCRPRYRR